MLIYVVAGFAIGFLAGAGIFFHPRLAGHVGRFWWRYVGRPRKLIELIGLAVGVFAFCAAALAAYFAYQQIQTAEAASRRQLRAYVLFDKVEESRGYYVRIKFKNLGETPAFGVQTTCTHDKLTD
jgi:hypothetical protein